MIEIKSLDQRKYSQVFKYLVTMEKKTNVRTICRKLEVTANVVKEMVLLVDKFNFKIEIDRRGKMTYLIPPKIKLPINFRFNIIEWLQNYDQLALKIQPNLSQYDYQLKNFKSAIEEQTDSEDQLNFYIDCFENAIMEQLTIKIKLSKKKKAVEVFPRKIAFIDKTLCVICEDLKKGLLGHFNINDIDDVVLSHRSYRAKFAFKEIEKYISDLRSFAQSEIRLILKFNNREKIDSIPQHHFYKNPCVVTNPKGEYIWAASVEPCDNLYEWLSELGHDVEILDPRSFKKTYLEYCEEKLRRIA